MMARRGRAGPGLGFTIPAPIIGAMTIRSDNPGHGFQFPGTFEISAMGAVEGELHLLVPARLQAAGLTVLEETVRIRPSAKGNYVSVTVSFVAQCREDYDAAHGALRACPEIRWTL